MLNSHWDGEAATYDALRVSWLQRRKGLFLANFLGAVPAGKWILELGSGTGANLVDLASNRPDLNFIGIEPNAGYVEYSNAKARKQGLDNVQFKAAFAEELPTALAGLPPVARIMSTDVLHHVRSLNDVSQGTAEVAEADARWMLLEPSWLNPYIAYFQARTEGEKNFNPHAFRRAATGAWKSVDTSYLNVIPSFIREPSSALLKIERLIEGMPVVCGTIAMEMRRR